MSIKHCAIIFILLLAGTRSFAQYRYEVGGFGGGTVYVGDANPVNIFSNVGGLYGAIARYNINYRSAIKVNMLKGSVTGNVSKDDPNFPGIVDDLQFAADYYDMGISYEYNFFPYTRDNEKNASAISPYVFVGLGISYTQQAMFNMPFGLGFKYLLTPRINIGAEMSIRKLFSDHLEGRGSLNDPEGLNGSVFINNDYYTGFGFFITIGLSNRVWRCRNL